MQVKSRRQPSFNFNTAAAILVGLLGSLATGTATADAISYDGFDYPSGSLTGNSGGNGWANAWTGTVGTVQTGTLHDPTNTLATSPGSAQVNSGDAFRDSSTTFGADGTEMWASFLISPQSNSYGGLNLGDLFIGDLGSLYGINTNGGGGSQFSTVASTDNVTTFLVVKIDFAAGNDTVNLYVNPVPGNTPPGSASATKTDHDLGSFSLVRLETGANYTFDELRLGATYASVAPAVPEPSSLILAGLAALGLLVAARRRKA